MPVDVHSTAVVADGAELGVDVSVGPYAVIDENVVLGDRCYVGPHAVVTGWTTCADDVRVHAHAVVGDEPQDKKYVRGTRSYLDIGPRTEIREFVSINPGCPEESYTRVGSDCLLMATSHVGHNCEVGDNVIMANGTMLGGHVTIGDRVVLGGDTAVHQFCRIGTLALTRGGSRISKDVPPCTIVVELGQVRGYNVVGMRRAGWNAEERELVKKYYRIIFDEVKTVDEAVAMLKEEASNRPRDLILPFISEKGRGICRPNTGRGYNVSS